MTENQEQGQAAVRLLFSLLQPQMIAETQKLASDQVRLVHYTSAENAMAIIKAERFWLRNVRCMNDYSEVQHGIQMLLRVFGDKDNARRERLVAALDKVAEGAARAGISDFDEWIPTLPDSTFIGCLSQWDDVDPEGRLSMWRAYTAKGAGVAMIMNKEPFVAETDELKAYSLPVAYLTELQFAQSLDNCLDAIEEHISEISILDFDTLRYAVFWWLLTMAVSLKHPAFAEEKEWRVIYLPNLWRSQVIEESVETIGGIPQVVQKIPLKHDPSNGLFGADLNNLMHRLVIGPSEFPLVLYDAFNEELKKRGVSDAADRSGFVYTFENLARCPATLVSSISRARQIDRLASRSCSSA